MYTLLFAYGTLKHDICPPKTLDGYMPAEVKADCYDSPHHDYPLALNFGSSSNVLHGELLAIDSDELPTIDKRETHKLYDRERIEVQSSSGPVEAWVYVWHRPVPAGAKLISEWTPDKESKYEQTKK